MENLMGLQGERDALWVLSRDRKTLTGNSWTSKKHSTGEGACGPSELNGILGPPLPPKPWAARPS